jgi:SAM-dependent methyltransferase
MEKVGVNMFFPERIKSIKAGDRVLEIGPGATPHPRSDVLLEKSYESECEYLRQCGGLSVSDIDNRIVFYDGGRFPFQDNEFDYVICSHVIEHIDDVEQFCEEMFRVARTGYIEYPLFYYEYVFDIPEHVNVLMKKEGALVYSKKIDVMPEQLKAVQKFWFNALTAGYTDTVSQLVPYLMEGFEWGEPFVVRKAKNIAELCREDSNIPMRLLQPKTFFRRLLERFKLR